MCKLPFHVKFDYWKKKSSQHKWRKLLALEDEATVHSLTPTTISEEEEVTLEVTTNNSSSSNNPLVSHLLGIRAGYYVEVGRPITASGGGQFADLPRRLEGEPNGWKGIIYKTNPANSSGPE